MLVLLSRGMTRKQIAKELTISAKTVSNHEEHIYAKLGVSTRGAAALFAMQHGLITVGGVTAGLARSRSRPKDGADVS